MMKRDKHRFIGTYIYSIIFLKKSCEMIIDTTSDVVCAHIFTCSKIV